MDERTISSLPLAAPTDAKVSTDTIVQSTRLEAKATMLPQAGRFDSETLRDPSANLGEPMPDEINLDRRRLLGGAVLA